MLDWTQIDLDELFASGEMCPLCGENLIIDWERCNEGRTPRCNYCGEIVVRCSKCGKPEGLWEGEGDCTHGMSRLDTC